MERVRDQWAKRWGRSPGNLGRQEAVVSGNAMGDGAVVAADDAGDLAVAVAALGMVEDEPPELVARGSDGTASTAAAELIAGDAASATDGIEQLEQPTGGQLTEDDVGTGIGGHGGVVRVEDGGSQEP
jgi:hypothetical protein